MNIDSFIDFPFVFLKHTFRNRPLFLHSRKSAVSLCAQVNICVCARVCVCARALLEQWNSLLGEFFLHVYRETHLRRRITDSKMAAFDGAGEGRGERERKEKYLTSVCSRRNRKDRRGRMTLKTNGERGERERRALRNHFSMSR